MSRITDKELKALVSRINSILGLDDNYGTKGAIMLSHRYDRRAIDQFHPRTSGENTLATGLTAMETKLFLQGILAGFTLQEEKADRKALANDAKRVEGFSNYETAMAALFLANEPTHYGHIRHKALAKHLTYDWLVGHFSIYRQEFARKFNISSDSFMRDIDFQELVDHFNSVPLD